jgi:lysylphosphatidylglycerol synthetase-like protein (DUF2156 family)
VTSPTPNQAEAESSAEPSADDDPGGAPDPAPSPAVLAARRTIASMRRVPFTATVVLATLAIGAVIGGLWSAVQDQAWLGEVAFGVPSFEAGRWQTIATGALIYPAPLIYLVGLAAFAVGVGFTEWRLGTLRTIAVVVLGHVASILLAALFLVAVRATGWEWATVASTGLDLGFSAGLFAGVGAATATLRPPWRLRLRLVLLAYALFSIALLGQLADLIHVVAVLLGLALSAPLAGPRAIRVASRPSKGELRLIASAGLLLLAASQLIVHVIPDRPTPFGPADPTPWTGALVLLDLAAWLLIARGLRRGRPWAWWIAVVIAVLPVAASVLLLAIALASPADAATIQATVGLQQLLAGAAASIAYLVVLLLARRAFQAPKGVPELAASTEDPDTARRLLKTHGGSSISWMTTWPRMRHMVTADGESFIGFREHLGVAIALGDPSGPVGCAATTIEDFVERCEAANSIPFLFSCTGAVASIARVMGWKTVQIAEENLIDLPDLAFTGKAWQNVRTALNKAPKEGISFRLGALRDEPPEIREQVERVSEAWLGEKALPEMGFTLGGVPEALDPDVRCGLAVGADGRLHGITSWLPAYRADGTVGGWTLDVMRRIEFEGNFRPTMEFLIASSALAFKEQGSSYVSLSGAPLARSGPAATDGSMEQLLDTIGALMEPLYGFRSLHAFKAKFQPRLDPMWMAYRDEADLPRIGLAISRAFLPDAGVGDMVAVGRTALGH